MFKSCPSHEHTSEHFYVDSNKFDTAVDVLRQCDPEDEVEMGSVGSMVMATVSGTPERRPGEACVRQSGNRDLRVRQDQGIQAFQAEE